MKGSTCQGLERGHGSLDDYKFFGSDVNCVESGRGDCINYKTGKKKKKKKKVKIVGMGDSDMVASYRISLGGIIMYIWFDMV